MPEHVWPALAKPPHRRRRSRSARFASASTSCGSLPPSSSTQPFSRSAHADADAAADLDRAGEEDLGRARLDQRLADRPPPWTVRTRPSGSPARSNTSLDPLADQRRERRRLEHHAVARHQRDRDLAERDRPRVVPRRDHADDAERLVGEAGRFCLQKSCGVWTCSSARIFGPVVGDPVERVDRRQELHHVRLVARLALLARDQRRRGRRGGR